MVRKTLSLCHHLDAYARETDKIDMISADVSIMAVEPEVDDRVSVG